MSEISEHIGYGRQGLIHPCMPEVQHAACVRLQIARSKDDVCLIVQNGSKKNMIFLRVILHFNDRLDPARFEGLDQAVCIIGFVGKKGARGDLIEERFGLSEVGRLPWGDRHRDGITEGIGDHMDSWSSVRLGIDQWLDLAFGHLFFGAGTMLMGAYNSGIEHHVLVIMITRQDFENTFENTTFAPPPETRMDFSELTETAGKITPRNAGSVTIEHRFDKQTIVFGRTADVPFTTRKKILDPIPLIVSQPIATHRPAPKSPTTHELLIY